MELVNNNSGLLLVATSRRSITSISNTLVIPTTNRHLHIKKSVTFGCGIASTFDALGKITPSALRELKATSRPSDHSRLR